MQHCAGFISTDSLYMFRASGAHHQEYLTFRRRNYFFNFSTLCI